MADYDKSTGPQGTMRIRDLGSTIEFWLDTSSPGTWFNSVTFNWSSPHGSGSFNHGYEAGGTWQKMGQITVNDSGNVSWTMAYTGTYAFGGPTTQTVYISREEKPGNPSGLSERNISYTVGRLDWENQGALNGGDFIHYQIQVSSTPQSGTGNFTGTVEITDTITKASSKTYAFEGLVPGRVYDWHVRQKTTWGYSNWSGIDTFQMLHGAWVKSGGAWSKAVPYVKEGSNPGSWKIAVPYIKTAGVWEVPDRGANDE